MMRLSRTALLIPLLAGALSACSRPAPAPSPVGTWLGYYNNDPSAAVTTANNAYAAVVRADGTVTFYDGTLSAPVTDQAPGTWTYTDGIFKATYTYPDGGPTYSVASTLTTADRMDGTWGSGNSATGGGKFYLLRQ